MDHTASWFKIQTGESPRLHANQAALRRRFPKAAASVERSAAALDQYQFIQTGHDQYACRQCLSPSPFEPYPPRWFRKELPGLYKHMKDRIERGTELLFLTGCGLGYTVTDLLALIQDTRNTSIILIENRPELIYAQFCLFDCREALHHPDIHWIIGDPCLDDLHALLEEEALYTQNRNRIAALPERALQQHERTEYIKLSRWFSEKQQAFFSQQNAWQAQYDRRVKHPANLQTGIVWTAGHAEAYAHTPLLKSLSSGLAELGMQRRYFPLNQSRTNSERITQDLLKTCPDAYLFLHLASARVIPAEIERPRVIWYLDHPKHYEWDANRPAFYHNDFIFYSDRHYASYFSQTDAGGTYHLTVCPSLRQPGSYRKELAAPVMFVGSHNPVASMTRHLKGNLRDHLFHVMDELLHNPTQSVLETAQKLNISEASLHSFFQTAAWFTSTLQREFVTPTDQLEYFFYALTNSYKRERFIQPLLDMGLVIYGPDSWLTWLGETYADRYRGWLSHEDLADAYTSADLCINLHSLQCPTCLNSRDLDVLTAGGCLVSDWVEDMNQGYLQPGRDAAVYTSPQQLAALVAELLEDHEKRELLRTHGHQTVIDHHQPVHRARQIQQALQSRGWG